jgi:mannan endo-1,4-beta-mannosidase
MESDWDQLQTQYGDRKLVALSESGTLPDPEVITAYGIWWSWFSLWNGRFVRDVDEAYLTHVFNSDRVMTRDELPDWRALYTDAEPEPVPSTGAIDLDLYPNPGRDAVTLRTRLPDAADVRVDVFDVTGRSVRSYRLGTRPGGDLTARIEAGPAAGVYFVRLVAGAHAGHGILTVVR